MEDIEKIEKLESDLKDFKCIAEDQREHIEELLKILASSLTEREVALLRLPAALQVRLKFTIANINDKAMGY